MTVRARYVVTVDRSGSRLMEFLAQDGASEFQVVDGVDLRLEPPTSVARLVDEVALLRRYGRLLAPGEVGCALSHRKVMNLVAEDTRLEDDDAVLVVEDDAVLHPDLESLLPWLTRQTFDLMPLHHGSADRLGIPSCDGSRLVDRLYPLSPLARRHSTRSFSVGVTSPDAWMGTIGYLVRKRAAIHLASSERGALNRVADDYRLMGEMGLRVCQVRPSLLWESDRQGSVITPTGRILGGVDVTTTEVARRMADQAKSGSLRLRKQTWLLGRDLLTRLPWKVRYVSSAQRLRFSWNELVPRMPARIRHLIRPGTP